MAITINGTGSITGLTAGGLPDGSITTDDLAANAVTAAKLAAGAGGKILQVVQTVKTDTFSDTQSPQFTDWVDVTGLSVSITPASTSNKILVLAQVSVVAAAAQPFAARLLRGSTAIHIADTSGSRTPATVSARQESGQSLAALPITFLDSPSTTSATTYKIQVAAESTVYVNRTGSDSDASSYYRASSSIIAMEVAG
jgi:hypothetical protein